ncbi:MAG: flagellar basal body L-ring protein FlgH [Alphaproteobacteria bacterium]
MKFIILLIISFVLLGCQNLQHKLSTIGEPPPLSQIEDPTKLPNYQPISMPMPYAQTTKRHSNSLWESGSRAFFKDQRAHKTGDIVTVTVNIDQKESISMNPKIERESKMNMSVTDFMGLESKAEKLFPKKQHAPGEKNPSWLNFGSNPSLSGKAKYNVEDKLKFKIAATIIQVLPNGNLVVQGRQEIRLVNEVREVQVKGVARPEDITSTNIIDSNKIAELRISYGGRGELSDMQSFPWGQQIINKVSPF